MTLVAAKCPQCGAAIQLPDEVDRANCMYCGATLMVKEALKQNSNPGVDAKRLIELGETSLEANRAEEAYNYFRQAIEGDASLANPWYGKARSSWRLATLDDTRKDEIVLCCNKFVELSARKGDSLMKASELLSTAASGLAEASFNHFKQYGGTLIGRMGSAMAVTSEIETCNWINRLSEAVVMHIDAIKYSIEAESGVEQATANLLDTLMSFVDNCYFMQAIQCHAETSDGQKIHSNQYNVLLRGIEDSTRSTLLGVYDNYQKRLIKLNPSLGARYQDLDDIFKKQNEKTSSSGLCFVATACYGTQDADDVVALRMYRDMVLKKSPLGLLFIEKYYRYGPYVARLIENRPILMYFGRVLICTPFASFARLVLKNRQ